MSKGGRRNTNWTFQFVFEAIPIGLLGNPLIKKIEGPNPFPRTSTFTGLETTMGVICGDPTQLKASSQLDIVQIWRVRMLMKAQLEEIIQGLHQGIVGGQKGSIEGNSSTCKKGITPDMILMRGFSKGNETCLISTSNLVAVIRNES